MKDCLVFDLSNYRIKHFSHKTDAHENMCCLLKLAGLKMQSSKTPSDIDSAKMLSLALNST